MSPQQPTGGFSLFPSTRPPSRNQGSRPRAYSPEPASATEMSPIRLQGRETPQSSRHGGRRVGSRTRQASGRQAAMDGRPSLDHQSGGAATVAASHQVAPAVTDVPLRCDTAFSEAQTLVRSSSPRSRSSIAKRPFPTSADSSRDENEGVSGDQPHQQQQQPQPAPALRSIFPQYNPTLPADRQEYYPTQTSPTHIPRAVISRPLYSPVEGADRSARSYQPVRPQPPPVQQQQQP